MKNIKYCISIIIIFLQSPFFSQEILSQKYNLMPWPKEIKSINQNFKINSGFTISINKEEGRVYDASTKFIRRLTNRTGIFMNHGFPFINKKDASLVITFQEKSILNLNTDESYTLSVNNKSIQINAFTDIGALRALQTLLQLTNFTQKEHYFSGIEIKDSPRFKWRGLMIDAARHFQPIAVIKRNLDAMASVKMNIFHWHLTDDQGFRIESKIYPKLHKIASDGLFYTQNQIRDIVNYANSLGIRVIPEIDVPGHATALLTAYPELGSKDTIYEIERFSGIFNPTLNPTKIETYIFLDNLFKEITPLFPDEYFHIGGDENAGKHWDTNIDIQAFKNKNNFKTNHDLQTYFNIKLEKILKKYNKKLIGWDEIMTPNMPKTAIIHSWRGKNEGLEKSTLIKAAKNGYSSILSNGFYIDRMQSVDEHYLIEPIGNEKLSKQEETKILGGEATMWSELVTSLTIDSRIWPRTAAIAERFWSQKNVVDIDNMRKRLKNVNSKLEELGITHIKNSNTILRNITKHQSITSLQVLTKLYEPLKIYTRNKDGIKYKSFSPFTLFADACSTDAEDAYPFKKLVSQYIKDTTSNKTQLILYFNKWKKGYNQFTLLNKTSHLKEIQPFYKKLNNLSVLFIKLIETKNFNAEINQQIKNHLKYLHSPMVDTELAILKSLEKLFKKLSTKK